MPSPSTARRSRTAARASKSARRPFSEFINAIAAREAWMVARATDEVGARVIRSRGACLAPPRRMRILARASTLAVACAMVAAAPASAQYFGRNKVQYRKLDFQILKTEHFDIYYYPEEHEGIASPRVWPNDGTRASSASSSIDCGAASRSYSTVRIPTSSR